MALQEFPLIKKRAIYKETRFYISNCHCDIVKICQIVNSLVQQFFLFDLRTTEKL